MDEVATLERWIHGISIIPSRSGGALSEQRVARLVSQRLGQGWQLVSDDTQGDGTRALRFRRTANSVADDEVRRETLEGADVS